MIVSNSPNKFSIFKMSIIECASIFDEAVCAYENLDTLPSIFNIVGYYSRLFQSARISYNPKHVLLFTKIKRTIKFSNYLLKIKKIEKRSNIFRIKMDKDYGGIWYE